MSEIFLKRGDMAARFDCVVCRKTREVDLMDVRGCGPDCPTCGVPMLIRRVDLLSVARQSVRAAADGIADAEIPIRV